jgi:hypothetical protein
LKNPPSKKQIENGFSAQKSITQSQNFPKNISTPAIGNLKNLPGGKKVDYFPSYKNKKVVENLNTIRVKKPYQTGKNESFIKSFVKDESQLQLTPAKQIL